MEATDTEHCDLNKNCRVPLLFFQPSDVWIDCTFQHFGKEILPHVTAKGMFQCHCWGGCRETNAFRKQLEDLIHLFFHEVTQKLVSPGYVLTSRQHSSALPKVESQGFQSTSGCSGSQTAGNRSKASFNPMILSVPITKTCKYSGIQTLPSLT